MEGHRARKNVEPLSRGRPVRPVQGRSRVLRGIRRLPRERRQGRRPLRGREEQTDLRRPPDQAARNEIHPRTSRAGARKRPAQGRRGLRFQGAPRAGSHFDDAGEPNLEMEGRIRAFFDLDTRTRHRPIRTNVLSKKVPFGGAHRPHPWGEKSRGVPKTPPAEVAEVGRRPTRISCRRLCWRCHARRGPLSARAGLRRA
jgi:hypothetical protein